MMRWRPTSEELDDFGWESESIPATEQIRRVGDFTVAIEKTSIQGWKVLVIGGPTDRTVCVGLESRGAAESAARAYAETL